MVAGWSWICGFCPWRRVTLTTPLRAHVLDIDLRSCVAMRAIKGGGTAVGAGAFVGGGAPPPTPYGAPPPPPVQMPGPYGAPGGVGSSTPGAGALAQWPQRALGYIVDYALSIPGSILYFIGLPKTTTLTINGQTTASTSAGNLGLLLLGLVIMIAVWVWNRGIKGGQGQTIGRTDRLIVEHMERDLELVLFFRMDKREHPGAGFRYEGTFRYQSHGSGGPPTNFHLVRTSGPEG